MKLSPGKFYRARNGDLWCCYLILPDAEEHARAQVINLFTGKVDYCYASGRIFNDGDTHPHDLINEESSDCAIIRGRR